MKGYPFSCACGARETQERKMKVIKQALSILIITLIGFIALDVKAGTLDFSVNPNLPTNQANAGEGYFDLLMKAGTSQTVTVTLTNNAASTITVDIAVSTATTNMNGIVQYSPTKAPLDKSLKYNLADLVKSPQKVTLQPKSNKTISLTVTMPNQVFNGIIAGGVTFKEENQAAASEAKKGMTITNTYQYVLGFLLRQTHTLVAPDLSLGKVAPSQVNARNVINATLTNSAMGYLNDMNVKAEITGITNSKLKYSYDNAAMEMAPNTTFALPILVSIQGAITNNENSQPLQAGKYQLSLTVYGKKEANGKYETTVNKVPTKYDYEWTFNQDFTITARQANTLNATDVTVPKANPLNLLVYVGIGIVILALLLIFFLLRRKRKAKESTLQAQLEEMQEKLNALNKNSD